MEPRKGGPEAERTATQADSARSYIIVLEHGVRHSGNAGRRLSRTTAHAQLLRRGVAIDGNVLLRGHPERPPQSSRLYLHHI